MIKNYTAGNLYQREFLITTIFLPLVRPLIVVSNNSENAIKSILETEFKIDRDAKFPTNYGSNYIKAGTKISLRYF
jgi:hypothetical protein